MTVFDFDKTLTNEDTLFGFYRMVCKNEKLFYMKRYLLLLFGIMFKLRLVNNRTLKKIGVFLFLKNKSRESLLEYAELYKKSVQLNEVYYSKFLNVKKDTRIIMSASFIEYLVKIFPEEKVFGSRLQYVDDKVVGLKDNLYGNEKAKLAEKLALNVTTVYTDSLSDKPLIDLAENAFLVYKGQANQIK